MKSGSTRVTLGATALTLMAGCAGALHKEAGRDWAASGAAGLTVISAAVLVKNEAQQTGWMKPDTEGEDSH